MQTSCNLANPMFVELRCTLYLQFRVGAESTSTPQTFSIVAVNVMVHGCAGVGVPVILSSPNTLSVTAVSSSSVVLWVLAVEVLLRCTCQRCEEELEVGVLHFLDLPDLNPGLLIFSCSSFLVSTSSVYLSFRTGRYIVGVRYWGVSIKRGFTVLRACWWYYSGTPLNGHSWQFWKSWLSFHSLQYLSS